MHQTFTTNADSIVVLDGRNEVMQLSHSTVSIFPKGYVSARWGSTELLFFDLSDCSNAPIRRAFVLVTNDNGIKYPNNIILFQLMAMDVSAKALDSILSDFTSLRHDIMSCTVDPTTYADYTLVQRKFLTKLSRGDVPLDGASRLPQALIFASQTFLEYVLQHSYCSTDWKVQPELRAHGVALVNTLVKYQDTVPTHCKVISTDYMDKLIKLPASLSSSLLPDELASFIQIDDVYRRKDYIECHYTHKLFLFTMDTKTVHFKVSKLYNNTDRVELFDGEIWHTLNLSDIVAVNARSYLFSREDHTSHDMLIACRYLFTFGTLPTIYSDRRQRHLNLLLLAEADLSFIKLFINHGMRLIGSSIEFLPHNKDYLKLLKWYTTRKSRSYADFPELVAALLTKKMYKSVRSVLSAGDIHVRYFADILRNQVNDLRFSVFTHSSDHVVSRSDFNDNGHVKSTLMAHNYFNVDSTIYPPYLNTLVLYQPCFIREYLDELHKQQHETYMQDMQASLEWILTHEEPLLPLLTCVLNQAKDKGFDLTISEDQKSHLISKYPFSNILKELLGCDTVLFSLAVSAHKEPLVEDSTWFTNRCSKVLTELITLQKDLYALVGARDDNFAAMVALQPSLTPRDRNYFLKLADVLSREHIKFSTIFDVPSDSHYNTIRFGALRVKKFQARYAYCAKLLANANAIAEAKSVSNTKEDKSFSVRRPITRSVMQQTPVCDSKLTNAVRYKPIWTCVIRAFSHEYDLLSDEHKHLGLVRFINAVQRLNYLFEHVPDASYMRNSYVQTNLARNFASHRLLCLSEDSRQSVLAKYEAILDHVLVNTESDYDPKLRVSDLIALLVDLESTFPKSLKVVKPMYNNLLTYSLAKYKLDIQDAAEQVALLVDIGVCVTELYNSTESYPIEEGLGSCLQGLRNIVVHDVFNDTDLGLLKDLQAGEIATNLAVMDCRITKLVKAIVTKPAFTQLIEDNRLSDPKCEIDAMEVANNDKPKVGALR